MRVRLPVSKLGPLYSRSGAVLSLVLAQLSVQVSELCGRHLVSPRHKEAHHAAACKLWHATKILATTSAEGALPVSISTLLPQCVS